MRTAIILLTASFFFGCGASATLPPPTVPAPVPLSAHASPPAPACSPGETFVIPDTMSQFSGIVEIRNPDPLVTPEGRAVSREYPCALMPNDGAECIGQALGANLLRLTHAPKNELMGDGNRCLPGTLFLETDDEVRLIRDFNERLSKKAQTQAAADAAVREALRRYDQQRER